MTAGDAVDDDFVFHFVYYTYGKLSTDLKCHSNQTCFHRNKTTQTEIIKNKKKIINIKYDCKTKYLQLQNFEWNL